MVETAYILNHDTDKSLIIMDEIGRGTSTYDGISIAWATAQYLVTHFSTPPKTLFATHYHELQALEEKFPQTIKNYHMSVEQKNGAPIFLYTFQKGGASHSFGVSVAKLAGVPEEVVKNAEEMLHTLEHKDSEEIVIASEAWQSQEILGLLLQKELQSIDLYNPSFLISKVK